jgi:epoxide hydrolase-like predicted phosphatase
VIKAVIFDFFGVICSDEYWQFVKQDRQTDAEYRDYTDEVNLGQIPWQSFVQKISQATGKSIDEVNHMYETERIDPRVTGLIHELHKSYKTGLITNAHHDFIDTILSENNLSQLFDVTVVSSRLGVIKPDPRIFEYTLDKLQIEPAEAVFIDDLDRHVSAARELGIQTVLFENFEQCKQELDTILSAQ